MTAPTPEEVERVGEEINRVINTIDGHPLLERLARWHLARVQPAPDERKRRVVETARALFVHLDAGHRGDPERDLARSFDLARDFETAADAYLNGGAS